MINTLVPVLRPFNQPRALVSSARRFSTCPTCPAASPLFHLQAFSNQRESRWLAKGSGLSPVEHSTQLQLIRSSEGLDPTKYDKSTAKKRAASRPATPGSKAGLTGPTAPAATVLNPLIETSSTVSGDAPKKQRWSTDEKTAMSIGRAVLARHATQRMTYKRKLARLERKSRKLYRQTQKSSILIVLAVAVATGSAAWALVRERQLNARESSLNLKESLGKGGSTQTFPSTENRLAAFYTTPELHDLLEWQRLLGAQEAMEAREIQKACEVQTIAKKTPWWQRLFWS